MYPVVNPQIVNTNPLYPAQQPAQQYPMPQPPPPQHQPPPPPPPQGGNKKNGANSLVAAAWSMSAIFVVFMFGKCAI